MITLINDDARNVGGAFDMLFTDPPFNMSGIDLKRVIDGFSFDHLVLICSMRQVIEFAPLSNLDFCFDLVVSHITPKKSRSYAQPNYLHANIVYFKREGVQSAFDRRLVERHDHYSDKKTHYYPSIFHAPKNDMQYKYKKNQAMINDLVGAFNVQTICDPFAGSGTTGFACLEHQKDCTLIEQNCDAFAIMKQQFSMLGVSCWELV